MNAEDRNANIWISDGLDVRMGVKFTSLDETKIGIEFLLQLVTMPRDVRPVPVVSNDQLDVGTTRLVCNDVYGAEVADRH